MIVNGCRVQAEVGLFLREIGQGCLRKERLGSS
jgi:hypothetical protein